MAFPNVLFIHVLFLTRQQAPLAQEQALLHLLKIHEPRQLWTCGLEGQLLAERILVPYKYLLSPLPVESPRLWALKPFQYWPIHAIGL